MQLVDLYNIREALIQRAMGPEGLPSKENHLMLVSIQLWDLLSRSYPDKEKAEFYGYPYFEVRVFVHDNLESIQDTSLVQSLIKAVESSHFLFMKFKYDIIWE